MITFLASPKPFNKEVGEIQIRAIESWLALNPETQIILYGLNAQECPTRISQNPRVRTIPNVLSSGSSAPLFNSIVKHAESISEGPLIYANCDIIFTTELVSCVDRLSGQHRLLIGQRIDLAQGIIPCSGRFGVEAWLADMCRKRLAGLHSECAIDYFVFSRGMFATMPPAIVGRAGIDGAIIAHCLRSSIQIVDITDQNLALHQYHGYDHVRGGVAEVWFGLEAQKNLRLNSVRWNSPNVRDADFFLTCKDLKPSYLRRSLLRSAELEVRFRWGIEWTGFFFAALNKVFKYHNINKSYDPVAALDEMLRRREGAQHK